MSCTGECFDIGNQTRASLEHWLNTCERPRHKGGARGNGALMRVAPVALANFGRKQDLYLAAHRQSVITHHIDSGHLAGTYAEIVRACLRSGSPGEAMATLRSFQIVPLRRPRHTVKSTGYDLDTFEAAVWAVQGAKTAEGAIIRAANLGDDADTVGAVAGALAGAVWGAAALPERWLDKLAWRHRIEDAADRLLAMHR
jgi:ADP-ribosyl-[dinitrogen reductase] hydrolase